MRCRIGKPNTDRSLYLLMKHITDNDDRKHGSTMESVPRIFTTQYDICFGKYAYLRT